MKKRILQGLLRRFSVLFFFFCIFYASSLNAFGLVDFVISKGHPCNVWQSQLNVAGAEDNFVRFKVKDAFGVFENKTLLGSSVDYLSTLLPPQTFETFISNLPVIQPLDFNLGSSFLGAKFGVDVCIPALDSSRSDVADWTVTISRDGPLLFPVEGDWFQQAQPLVNFNLLASNCSTGIGAIMSTSGHIVPGSCEVTTTYPSGTNTLISPLDTLTYNFKLLANRAAVFRLSLQEQFNSTQRLHRLEAGDLNVVFSANLPPLRLGDLLEKQLFWAVDPTYTVYGQQSSCTQLEFESSTGLAFDKMNLQGAQNSLALEWTGDDNDCSSGGTCNGGNKGKKNFRTGLSVLLANGQLAGPGASPSDPVKSFSGFYEDMLRSGESNFPSDGEVAFDFSVDSVYRDSSSIFFSTTISRLTGAGPTWRRCRVWFKRSQSFNCDSLPSTMPSLITLCKNMKENSQTPTP